MHSLDELTASGPVGLQPSTRQVFSVTTIALTTGGVVEVWDTVGNTSSPNAVRKLTVEALLNDSREIILHGAAFPQGIYVNIVSGVGVRVSVEHGM